MTNKYKNKIKDVKTYGSLGGSYLGGYRKFSATSIRYDDDDDKNCDCCSNNRNTLTRRELTKIKSYSKEFASSNKAPVLDVETRDKIKNEKAVDIAAAYKDNPEGLEDRKEEAYARFDSVKDIFAEYFIEKNEAVKEKLNIENMNRNKLPICANVLNQYLEFESIDKDKVHSSRLTGRDQHMGFLSKDAYSTYKDSMSKHEAAKHLIENNSRYIERNGNPDSIDRDFYRNELTVRYPSSENPSSENVETENAETENPSKRKKSLEEEELNTDSVKKPKKDDEDDSDPNSKGGGGSNNSWAWVVGIKTNNATTENISAETNNSKIENGSSGFFSDIKYKLFIGLSSGIESVLEALNNINMFF